MCLVQPADQIPGLGIELGHGGSRPGLHLLEQRQFLVRWLPEQQAGRIDGIVGRFLGFVIDRVFLVYSVDLPLKDAVGWLGRGFRCLACAGSTRAARA